MDKIFSIIASPLPFIVLISVVITVHELGHYWVGRFFGAAVESFSIGFGKPIFQVVDKRGTRWRLNWLPLGGFVKFVGEIQAPQDSKADPRAKAPRDENETGAAAVATASIATDEPVAKSKPIIPIGKSYPQIGPLSRMAVSLGGPFANFIFAIVVYAAMGVGLGVAEADHVRITGVQAGSPAATAGFKPGDEVVFAGGRDVRTSSDVSRATFLSAGEAVSYRIIRGGETMELTAVPAEFEERNEQLKLVEKIGRVGLQLEDVGLHVKRLNPIEAVGHGFAATGDALANTVNVLRRLVTGKDGLDKMSGPVGIYSLTDKVTDMHMKQDGVGLGERVRQSALRLLELAALLSIGVGFFNLLPVPVLDGGAVVLCLAEAAMGREVPEKVQRVGLTIGLACLVSFALVITWQDILRLLPGGF